MNRNPIFAALACLTLTASGLALSQGDGDQEAQRRAQEQRNGQQGNQRGDQPAQRQQQERVNQQQQQRDLQVQRQNQQQAQQRTQRQSQADNRGRSQQYRQSDSSQRQDERGAGPDQNWHRGDRLPPEYRNRNYVVDDWRAHNLNAPPRGYHWVQHGSDYILASIATGIIAQLLLNH